MTEMKQIVTVLILIGATLGGGAYAQQGGVQAQEISHSEFLSLSPEARDWYLMQEIRHRDSLLSHEIRHRDALLRQEIRSEAKYNAEFRQEPRTITEGLQAESNSDTGVSREDVSSSMQGLLTDIRRLRHTMILGFVGMLLVFGGGVWALIHRMDKRFAAMDRKFDAVINRLDKAGIPPGSPGIGGGSPDGGGGSVPAGAG